jgi:hypothetical protein
MMLVVVAGGTLPCGRNQRCDTSRDHHCSRPLCLWSGALKLHGTR